MADVPDLDDEFERGEFGTLREWLREHLHRHGRKFMPRETLELATGSETIDPEPYVRYLRAKVGAIYGLRPRRLTARRPVDELSRSLDALRHL